MLIRKLRSLEVGDAFTYNGEGYKVEQPYNEHSDEVWCKNIETGDSRLLRGKTEVELGYHKDERDDMDDYDLDR